MGSIWLSLLPEPGAKTSSYSFLFSSRLSPSFSVASPFLPAVPNLLFLPLPLPMCDILGGWTTVTVLTTSWCTGATWSYTNSCETCLSSQPLAPCSFIELHSSSLIVRKDPRVMYCCCSEEDKLVGE